MNIYKICLLSHAIPKLLAKSILIMKLSIVIVIIASLQVSASGYAQKITLLEKDATFKSILQKIEKQSGYLFWYENELLRKTSGVDIDVKNVSLKEALDETFINQPLTYSIVNKIIVIELRKTLGKREVRGSVTDSLGVLPGATINVKGQPNIGTTTDQNGKYILDVPNDEVVLVFSMIGYESKEVSVKGKTVINVVLRESKMGLDEVVVVAFGQQKKTELVGSVTTIKPSDLKVPSSNLTTALAGRAAGIIAYQRSGEPGQDNADFFIRGVTTFGYKKDPLILIDGVELTTTELARLQPDDISAFTIMKDATSTALYGARGANGVILVTTKEGKEGKATINFRLENSISTATKNVEFADPITYMKLFNESILTRNPLGELEYTPQKIDNTISGINPYMFPATDWRKMLFNDQAVNQRANLSISGGGKAARYYVAGSLNKDNGVLNVDPRNNFNNNIDLKSYNLRSNVNVNLTRSTEMIVRLNGNFDDYNGPMDGGAALYRKVTQTSPVEFPAFYPQDKQFSYVNHTLFGNDDIGSYINPYADMVRGYKEYSRSLMLAQLEFKQDLSFLVKGLSARTLLNTNRRSYFDVSRSYAPFYYAASSYNRVSNSYVLTPVNEDTATEYLDFEEGAKQVNSTFYLEAALNYTQTFKKHGISAMLVNIQRSSIETGGGTLQTSLPSRNLGLSGRTTYSYDNRYFAEFNFGYNGSERFFTNNRFGFFPSAGVAWNITQEKFMKPLAHIVSNLRLRGTYGLVGNDAIGSAADRFFYLSDVNMNDASRGAAFGDIQGYSRNGVSVSRYSNTDITWERAKKANLAVELGLFNSLNIVAEYFTEKRDNILMARTNIPVTAGLSAVTQANVGKASGKGLDLSLDYSKFFSNSFWIQSRANFTYASSKWVVNEEPLYEKEKYLSKIGYSLGQNWGYIAENLFVDEQEVANSPLQAFGGTAPTMAGDVKYRDVNGDGQITPLDMVPIGFSVTPEIVYGFGLSTGFKNIDISAFFQGVGRESFWIDATETSPFVNQRQLLKAYADNHWSEDNRNIYALWPRLSSAASLNNQQKSTWFMRDGSFLRLKSVELGYTIPKKFSNKIYSDKIRLYVSGTNLLTWSKFKLWDVEMAGNGLGYPIQRVFNFGINLSF